MVAVFKLFPLRIWTSIAGTVGLWHPVGQRQADQCATVAHDTLLCLQRMPQ